MVRPMGTGLSLGFGVRVGLLKTRVSVGLGVYVTVKTTVRI